MGRLGNKAVWVQVNMGWDDLKTLFIHYLFSLIDNVCAIYAKDYITTIIIERYSVKHVRRVIHLNTLRMTFNLFDPFDIFNPFDMFRFYQNSFSLTHCTR